MSRVTPIVTGLQQASRSISSSSSVGRPSTLFDSTARAHVYLPRALRDLKSECNRRQLISTGNKAELVERLTANDIVASTRGLHTSIGNSHRTLPPRARKPIPLMQGFHTSTPQNTAHDTSTIDYAFLPALHDEPTSNLSPICRVPLLPDNYTPDRSAGSANAGESLDEAVPGPSISVLAGNPDSVAAAMTEVVGNDGLDVDIGQLTSIFSTTQVSTSEEPGIVGELWSGLLDDVFGPKSEKTTG